MVKKTVVSAALAAFALLMSSSDASAGPLRVGQKNDVFFNNVENLFDSSGNRRPINSSIEPGDVFTGIFNVQNINAGGSTHFFSGRENQLSGIFAHEVAAVDPAPNDVFDSEQDNFPHITLRPISSGGPNTFTVNGSSVDLRGPDDSYGTADDLLNPTANEMFRLFRQTGPGTTPYETNGDFADDVGKATDGDVFASYGYEAGDDGVFGTSPAEAADDTGYVYAHAPSETSENVEGSGFVGTNFVIEPPPPAYVPLNDTNENEIGGPGSETSGLRGGPLFNDIVGTFEIETEDDDFEDTWHFASNDPFVVHPVPEPSSLTLLALGAGGLGFAGSRRRKGRREA